jgi:A/G-specific adenine glycosylase
LDKKHAFAKRLLDWYGEKKRELPWRKTKDPYAIWISEVMLQQTRVDSAIDYYERFLHHFPDVSSLAEAPEEDILALWKGLGYYSRARNLHKAARIVQEKFDGVFPPVYRDIRSLPGIGDYTAGAIASIAFNQTYPAVDGNVLRVIARIEGIEEDITQLKVKKQIGIRTSELIPDDRPGDFNQALMELGAVICTPKNPVCPECPVKGCCTASQTEKQNTLPVKKKAKTAAELSFWVAVIRRDGQILMEYRKNTTLLGKLWGFPMAAKSSGALPEEALRERYGLELEPIRLLDRVKYVFTHQIWYMDVIECALLNSAGEGAELAWISPEQLNHLPVPTAFQKVLDLFIANQNQKTDRS